MSSTREKQLDNIEYNALLLAVKERISEASTSAALAVNRELIFLYWHIGRTIHLKQRDEGWGTRIIERLAGDLKREIPDRKGFSAGNLNRMIQFYREYPALLTHSSGKNHAYLPEDSPQAVGKMETKRSADAISPQAVGKLEKTSGASSSGNESTISTMKDQKQASEAALVLHVPWGHNMLLISKVKDMKVRRWYMEQTVVNGWSRNVLSSMIESDAYERSGATLTNFDERLPEGQAALAKEVFRDEYSLDMVPDFGEAVKERDIERALIQQLERFLIELGIGFTFAGRQYHLELEGKDYYLDLLFFHTKLRCYIVIDLKIGEFIPEYAGKMNFYCNLVNERMREEYMEPTIGLILCQEKNKVVAKYALQGMREPIGVAEYKLNRRLPKTLTSDLPTVQQIEDKLNTSGV
ncbi:MAG: hypothetical protein CL946_05950 [Ectothiorhodospiraceae bacterium]|nr:hypothetical protein [Ectothiorhodospiraceae bacterium]